MLEKVIERKLVKAIEDSGGLCLKFISPSMAGIPDRLVLLTKGKCYFVETKAPHKKLRRLQHNVKSKLESLGFKVYVVDSLEKVDEVVKEMKGGD